MMKGKLMKSLFRGKGGVPRTPGGPVSNEGDEVKVQQSLYILYRKVPDNDQWCILLNTAPLLQPDPKDEVEWDGDGEVDVTVDLEENGLVEIEVRWKPELGRCPKSHRQHPSDRV